MRKFFVVVPEVHDACYEVFATSEGDAIRQMEAGKGTMVSREFRSAMDPEHWTAEDGGPVKNRYQFNFSNGESLVFIAPSLQEAVDRNNQAIMDYPAHLLGVRVWEGA